MLSNNTAVEVEKKECTEVVTSLPSKSDIYNSFLITLSIIRHLKTVFQMPDGKAL